MAQTQISEFDFCGYGVEYREMHCAMRMQREIAALGRRQIFLLPCQFQLGRGPPHQICYFRLSTMPVLKSSSIAPTSSWPILGTFKTQEEKKKYRGPVPKKDLMGEWIFKNDGVVRILPLYVGSLSLAAILVNRTLSGISPVADASSSQSRADVLTLALAVTVILTGLVWISIQPKDSSPVQLQGIECNRVEPGLPAKVAAELYWVWESLAGITCCRALVVVYGRWCFLQVGLAAESATIQGEAMEVDVCKFVQGSLCQGIWRSGKQNNLANLALYPGRSELLFLPENTQAVILQPLGEDGVMAVAGDTIRGFTESDQRWIAVIGEKLDATLSKLYPSETNEYITSGC